MSGFGKSGHKYANSYGSSALAHSFESIMNRYWVTCINNNYACRCTTISVYFVLILVLYIRRIKWNYIKIKSLLCSMSTFSFICVYIHVRICDQIWDNPPSTHNYKYLEIPILIIWSIITLEGKLILKWNLPRFYSYSSSIYSPTIGWIASQFSHHFR